MQWNITAREFNYSRAVAFSLDNRFTLYQTVLSECIQLWRRDVIEFRIATGSSAPIYRQIADQVRRGVASGALQAGEQLPSVRVLAEQLVVNPNTVARAYADLTRDGVLDSQAGKGLFVAPRRMVFSGEERARRLEAALETFVHEVLLLGFDRKELLERLKRKLQEIENGDVDSPKIEYSNQRNAEARNAEAPHAKVQKPQVKATQEKPDGQGEGDE